MWQSAALTAVVERIVTVPTALDATKVFATKDFKDLFPILLKSC